MASSTARAASRMNVVDPARVSRRTALTGLGALATAACSKLAFVAANVPAAFGSFKRPGNLGYGNDPSHRMDGLIGRPSERCAQAVMATSATRSVAWLNAEPSVAIHAHSGDSASKIR